MGWWLLLLYSSIIYHFLVLFFFPFVSYNYGFYVEQRKVWIWNYICLFMHYESHDSIFLPLNAGNSNSVVYFTLFMVLKFWFLGDHQCSFWFFYHHVINFGLLLVHTGCIMILGIAFCCIYKCPKLCNSHEIHFKIKIGSKKVSQ